MADVKVHGLSDLAAALKALPREIAGKNGGPLRSALRSAAVVIRNEARLRAPRESGRLSNAIAVPRDKSPGDVTERYVVKPKRGKSRNDPRGAYFWTFVEFGTEKQPKQPKQPFLRNAYDSRKDAALAEFKIKLTAGIKRAAKKAQRLGGTRGR